MAVVGYGGLAQFQQEGLEESQRQREMSSRTLFSDNLYTAYTNYWPSFSTPYSSDVTAAPNIEVYIDEKGNAQLRRKRRRGKIHLGNGEDI